MVEIIPKPIKEASKWQKTLFYFSILIFLGAIFSYPVLVSLQKKSKITLQDLEDSLSKTKTSQTTLLERELLIYQRKIKDFSLILNEHIFTSKFFEFLEKKSLPKVFFSKIDLDSRGSNVSLSGETDSFLTLGQQLSVFENEPLIKGEALSQFSIGKEGEIVFSLNFSFDPKILKY